MPGSPLSILYPEPGDSTTAVLVKYSTNFQTLQTDLEAKVTESDIRVSGPLLMYDQPLQDVGALNLSEQSTPVTSEGALTYANGQWYIADATGAIRLTDGAGGLNATGFKGIGGDYGAGDPSEVTYDAAAGAYSFTDDPGVYSDIKLERVFFQTAGGSTSVISDPTVASAITLTLPTPPVSGVSTLTVNSAGVIAPGVAVTNPQTFADLTATILRRPAATVAIPLAMVQPVEPVTNVTYTRAGKEIFGSATGVNAPVLTGPLQVEVGQQLNSVTVKGDRTNPGVVSLQIFQVTDLGVRTSISTLQSTAAASGAYALTANVTTPAAMPANVWYEFEVTMPLVVGTSVYSAFFNKQG